MPAAQGNSETTFETSTRQLATEPERIEVGKAISGPNIVGEHGASRTVGRGARRLQRGQLPVAATKRYHTLRVAERCDPMLAAVSLAEAGLFDSYMVYERDSEWWFAGGVLAEVEVDWTTVRSRWDEKRMAHPWTGNSLRQVELALTDLPLANWRAFGWATFELAYPLLGLDHRAEEVDTLLHLVVPHTEVRLRRDGARIRSVSRAALLEVWDALAKGAELPHLYTAGMEVNGDAGAFHAAVLNALAEIDQGKLQKVVLSRCIPVDFPVDFSGTYLLGRYGNTPSRSFLLALGGRRAAGFSPETIVEVKRSRLVVCQPLAGTRALGLGQDEDSRLRAELLADPKEIYEHALSLKLNYDELLTVCEPSTVHVDEPMTIRERGSVQHLGSTLSGRLPPGRTAFDALRNLFPAVTASGIPKPAACRTIARLEERSRDLYAGAVMMLDSVGTLDATLVLRSIIQVGGATWLRAGAGIVGASRPEREYQETCEKFLSVSPFIAATDEGAPTRNGGAAVATPGAVLGNDRDRAR
jgi:salicylate synthetase